VENCRGKCHRCTHPLDVCTSHPNGLVCLPCKWKGFKECKYPDEPRNAQVFCVQCKRYMTKTQLRKHNCRGRCKPCQDADEPCVPTRGPLASTKCQRCKVTPGNPECTGFSHQDSTEQEEKQKCEKCHALYDNVKTHQRRCKGRCKHCIDIGEPCGNKTKAGCGTCKRDNVTCPRDYSDQVEEERGECPRCKVNGLPLSRHVSTCSGRCPGCVKAKKPCVAIPGDHSGRCVRCREEKIVVCGKKDHAHQVEKVKCPDCDNVVPKHSFPQHKKHCGEKCTNCRNKGIACKRPPGTAARGDCDGCKEGKDGKPQVCDGRWKLLKEKDKEEEDPN
jgi:hypothetical protein